MPNIPNDAIGDFLLKLYTTRLISPNSDWSITDQRLQQAFDEYRESHENSLKKHFPKSTKIATVLRDAKCIIEEIGKDLKIDGAIVLEFRKKKIKEFEEEWKNDFLKKNTENNGSVKADKNVISVNALSLCPSVIECSYQGSIVQERNPHFDPTADLRCFICQLNFELEHAYGEHINVHNDDTDFAFLKLMRVNQCVIFTLGYQECCDSQNLFFTIESHYQNIVIEKIIIVLQYTMLAVDQVPTPYAFPTTGRDAFFVDSKLITDYRVNPLLVIWHDKNYPNQRQVEEHHFMYYNSVKKSAVNFSPCHLPDTDRFAPGQVGWYAPPVKIRQLCQRPAKPMEVAQISPAMKDYFDANYTFNADNISEVMRTMLSIEDTDCLLNYYKLIQHDVQLQEISHSIYSVRVKLPKLQSRTELKSTVRLMDNVLIVPETAATRAHKFEQTFNFLLTKRHTFQREHVFAGRVKYVNSDAVIFRCDENIPPNRTYMVVFRPSRNTIQYQYRSLAWLEGIADAEKVPFLCPDLPGAIDAPHSPPPTLASPLINKRISVDRDQLSAVNAILQGLRPEAPFIIFGPAGSGKTTTLVEAILQLYFNNPGAKMLVTANSNSACDEICTRLLSVLAAENKLNVLARIYAKCRNNSTIDRRLRDFSNIYGEHFYPNIAVLHEYRIVICTLSVVGILDIGQRGIVGDTEPDKTAPPKDAAKPAGYTHVFIDEAQAGTCPEALVAIELAISMKASLIISGDHKQLGPILESQLAKELGLDLSFMEHLMKRDCYRIDEDGNYDSQLQARLRSNYRSHREIVKMFSHLYYNDKLRPVADEGVYTICKLWHLSPNPEYPIIFHAVFGKCNRRKKSHSLFNLAEINIVMSYVKELLCFGVNGGKIKQTDIGIISPYKAQYQRIRSELDVFNWSQIETGSVETFQGKEKSLIIVSFVRSFGAFGLGFLKDPKRMNVILSRAKSLLLLIGNPQFLAQNANYAYILRQCEEHNTLVNYEMKNFKKQPKSKPKPKAESKKEAT